VVQQSRAVHPQGVAADEVGVGDDDAFRAAWGMFRSASIAYDRPWIGVSSRVGCSGRRHGRRIGCSAVARQESEEHRHAAQQR